MQGFIGEHPVDSSAARNGFSPVSRAKKLVDSTLREAQYSSTMLCSQDLEAGEPSPASLLHTPPSAALSPEDKQARLGPVA